MKPRILGIDGNWYLHRIYHTQYDSPTKGKQIAKRFVAMICKDALALKASRILVAFDGARIFRYKIYEQYKGNREHSTGESPYDYLAEVIEALAECGIPCVQISKYEADDVLCSLATQYTDKYDVYIGCRDKDAYQYVNEGVTLYDPSAKPVPRFIVHRPTSNSQVTVKSLTGLTPRQFLTLQLLSGDGIDNIPALMRVAAVKKGLRKYRTFKKWKEADEEFATFVQDNAEALRLNRKLVQLVADIPIEVPAIKWNADPQLPPQYQALNGFCNPRSRGLF